MIGNETHPDQGLICIHLSCGKRFIPGWIHIDIDKHAHIDYQQSVEKLSMFEDNYADLIYNSHQIAYYDKFQIQAVLKEWRRVLKPGGILRLSTPDFEKVIKVYQINSNLSVLYGFLYGRYETQNGPVFYRMVYDYTSLEATLLEAGFRGVKSYDWRKTIHKDYDDYSQAYLPHMDKEHGIMMSLNVEAFK